MSGYDPINKLYTVEQHRLADYFDKQQIFHPFSSWPAWLQDVALTCPKNFQQRTSMFFHLARNNMYPPTARSWVLACNVIDDKLIWSDAYPDDVKMDMARLVKKALAGEIVDEDAATYAHHLGRVVKGLKPGTCPPNPQQLAEISLRPKRQSFQGPSRTRQTTRQEPRTKVPGLVIQPATIATKPRGLSSGIRFVPKHGLWTTYWNGSKWVQRKLIPGLK